MPSDILGSEVMDIAADGTRGFRFVPRPGVHAAADGRRDQPRQPAHPVGAPAGDAGAPRHDRRRPPRPAGAVPRARHPEPARAGGHLSPPRGAARPLPAADRRRLSRPRRRAAHAVRDDRRDGGARPSRCSTSRRCASIQRLVRRMPVGESVVEAILNLVRSARPEGADSEARVGDRLGAGPARQPGADARLPRPRAHRRALCALARRRGGARRAGAPAPHGALLRGARRRPHGARRDRRAEGQDQARHGHRHERA